MSTKDLSPKLSLQKAETELTLPLNTVAMGTQVGGLSMYSTSFKRGYGDAVFGSDHRGIWLGGADFDNAPWKVDMQGNMFGLSVTLSQYISKTGTGQDLTGSVNVGDAGVKIDGANKYILISTVILMGYQVGGFE